MPFGSTWTGLNVVRSRLKKGTKIFHDKCRNSEQRISLKVACTNTCNDSLQKYTTNDAQLTTIPQ